jgi:hypothetical protein
VLSKAPQRGVAKYTDIEISQQGDYDDDCEFWAIFQSINNFLRYKTLELKKGRLLYVYSAIIAYRTVQDHKNIVKKLKQSSEKFPNDERLGDTLLWEQALIRWKP